MKAEDVYFGDIYVCSKYADRYAINKSTKIDVYKKDVILVKIDNIYMDLDDLSSDMDLLKKTLKEKKGYKSYYLNQGDKFVDESKLVKCYGREKDKTSIKTLKRDRLNIKMNH